MRATLFLLTLTVTLAAQTSFPSAAKVKSTSKKTSSRFLLRSAIPATAMKSNSPDFDWISARMRSAAAITGP